MAQTLLNEDLNIIAESNLEILPLDGDLAIIQKLDDEPNDVEGLTSDQLKAKFDQSGLTIQKYINESLIPQILAADATEAARTAAEAQREHQEDLRQQAEAQREANEQARADETAGIVVQATQQAQLAREWADAAQKAAAGGDHALRHAADGGDPITPEMIGAYSKAEVDARLENLTPGLLPQIVVTALTGSTVTCVKEDITLRVEENDGIWIFQVPKYGQWAVIIDEIVFKTILVDSVKQYVIDVFSSDQQEIHYTMLYDYGDECTDLTGGWQNPSDATRTFTKGESSLVVSGDPLYYAYWCAGFCTVNTMDLSAYSQLGFCFDGYFPIGNLSNSRFFRAPLDGNIRATAKGLGWYTSEDDYNIIWPVEVTGMDLDTVETTFTNKVAVVTPEQTQGYVMLVSANEGGTGSAMKYADLTMWSAFAVKEDDWTAICDAVGLPIPADLATLMGDAEAFASILSNINAVRTMVSTCTGDFMANAVASETFLAALEASPYKELVYANEHWSKFLAMVA